MASRTSRASTLRWDRPSPRGSARSSGSARAGRRERSPSRATLRAIPAIQAPALSSERNFWRTVNTRRKTSWVRSAASLGAPWARTIAWTIRTYRAWIPSKASRSPARARDTNDRSISAKAMRIEMVTRGGGGRKRSFLGLLGGRALLALAGEQLLHLFLAKVVLAVSDHILAKEG